MYNESRKKSTLKYVKNKQTQIIIRYCNDDYVINVLPAIKRSGLPKATFFKESVDIRSDCEKMIRDNVKADIDIASFIKEAVYEKIKRTISYSAKKFPPSI